LRRSPFCCGVAAGPHHDSKSDASIWGEIEPDTHPNGGQRAAEFSRVAAVSECLLRKLMDSRKKRVVRCQKNFLCHAKTFATPAHANAKYKMRGGKSETVVSADATAEPTDPTLRKLQSAAKTLESARH
jgi:hypothetical protein